GDHGNVDVFTERNLARVNFQNAFAATNVRTRNDDATIETAGSQQGGIEHIGPVGRGDQNDAVVRFEAVHFDQQLVQRLFAFVVSAAETGATMAADCVDLVDEDDARRVLFALFEQVADA